MKILIAEDDAVASQLLQSTLERMGHEVVGTRTGTEAWEAFDRAPVRVVVSDWVMPGMDGLEPRDDRPPDVRRPAALDRRRPAHRRPVGHGAAGPR